MQWKEKNKHRKIALLARGKSNTIENISKALIDSDISHNEFTRVAYKEHNYFRLKASERNMISSVTLKRRDE